MVRMAWVRHTVFSRCGAVGWEHVLQDVRGSGVRGGFGADESAKLGVLVKNGRDWVDDGMAERVSA